MDTYQLDAKLILSDGAAAYTANTIGQVASANQILDLGGAPPRTDLNITGGFAALRFAVVMDISAINIANTNNLYTIAILGSNSANGANPVWLGGLQVGHGAAMPNGTHSTGGAAAGTGSDSSIGRYIVFATSEENDVKYEFIYLWIMPAGTAPSITFKAFASMWPFE